MASAATMLAEADKARARGDVRAAVAVLERAERAHPRDAQVLNALAMRVMADDPARAQALLARAVEQDAAEPALWMNLAVAAERAGDLRAGLRACEAALERVPMLMPALVRRAQFLDRLGPAAHAIDAWKLALAAAPPPAERTPQLAAVLAEAHARVLADAERLGAMLDRAMPDAPPRVAHARDHLLGRRAIFTHRPTGLHVPRLPADEFFDPELFPWFGELNAAAGAIRAEAEALLTNDGGAFGPYVAYKPGTPVAQWEELNHSLRWGAAFLWRHGAAVEAMHARCPATVAALRATPTLEIPGRGPTAFFSLLAPRTRIPAHTGVTNARAIVHLPLVVPEGCGFRVGSETRTWREGEAFAFDDSIEHEAWNDGDQQRLVLIFDVWNPHLAANERAALSAMWMALDAANPDGSLFD